MAGAIDLKDLRKALSLGEDDDWEFKDGRGGVGKSWAETVSAFANTDGGTVVCGIESQDNDRIHVARGIRDAKDYREKIWTALRSKEVISRQCCQRGDVGVLEVDGVDVVFVRVPPAQRQHRPVHVGATPYGNTYRRYESMDVRCDDEEVDQMKRDARGAAQDNSVVRGSSLADIDLNSLKSYRNRLSSRTPESRLLALDDKALLKSLGLWREESSPNLQGLTAAGLLLFGKTESIAGAFPHLTLDYVDRSGGNPRHDHRITSDEDDWGSANLYNFYFEVYPHLVKGLQKPFALSAEAMREANTPFHDALREALINALIHTDYEQRGTIRVVKQADAFVFENPGRSLTPLSRIKEARGEHKNLSDIRNPHLAKAFGKLGLAEKEGYGYPQIYKAWEQGKRHDPKIVEDAERHLMVMTLPLLSQVSPGIENALRKIVGPDYGLLSSLDKDILVYAAQFGEVSTDAIRAIRKEHAAEVSARIRAMTGKGWLKKTGSSSRSPTYRLDGRKSATSLWADDLFGPDPLTPTPIPKGQGGDSVSEPRSVNPTHKQRVEQQILAFCDGQFRTAREIGAHLGRALGKLRINYLSPMTKDGRLQSRHPLTSGANDQAYKTSGT